MNEEESKKQFVRDGIELTLARAVRTRHSKAVIASVNTSRIETLMFGMP
jgi:hypothetical protein